jgi:hypothetical protein
VDGEIGALGEVLTQQALTVFSLLPRCQGLRGSQKWTGKPASTVSFRCWAISEPWSQVKERRNSRGSVVMVDAIASQTALAPWSWGR